MFGDMCHGTLLFLAGLALCHYSDDIFASINARSPMQGVMQIRYLLLLMGFYAAFCGLMYNDFASIPLFFKTSCYFFLKDEHGGVIRPQVPEEIEGCVHTVGVDPAWYLSSNEITYMNSLKMKLAVIVGVAHMSLGVLMKGFNAAYYKNMTDFFFEFVPQITMLLGLFGYMDYIIMAKWKTDWTGREHASPSIIASMIGMFLGGGEIPIGTDALLESPEH
jgi:V-type H+-transporting ATPase subunit a